jgi:hypothetical protein
MKYFNLRFRIGVPLSRITWMLPASVAGSRNYITCTAEKVSHARAAVLQFGAS